MWVLRTFTALAGVTFLTLALTTANSALYGPERIAGDGLRSVLDGKLSELPPVISDSYAVILGDSDYWVDATPSPAISWEISETAVEAPARNLRTVDFEIINRDDPNMRPLKVSLTLESGGINPLLGRAWKITGGLPLYRVALEKTEFVESADEPLVTVSPSGSSVTIPPGGVTIGPHPFAGTITASDSQAVEPVFFSVDPFDAQQQILTTTYIIWRPALSDRALQDVVALAQDLLSTCMESPAKVSNREAPCEMVRISDTPTDAREIGTWEELSCSLLTVPIVSIDSEIFEVSTEDPGQVRCTNDEGHGFNADVSLTAELRLFGNALMVMERES